MAHPGRPSLPCISRQANPPPWRWLPSQIHSRGHVPEVSLRNCRLPEGTSVFLSLAGKRTNAVSLYDNRFEGVSTICKGGPEVAGYVRIYPRLEGVPCPPSLSKRTSQGKGVHGTPYELERRLVLCQFGHEPLPFRFPVVLLDGLPDRRFEIFLRLPGLRNEPEDLALVDSGQEGRHMCVAG